MNNISIVLQSIKGGISVRRKDYRLRGFRKYLFHVMKFLFLVSSWILFIFLLFQIIEHGK